MFSTTPVGVFVSGGRISNLANSQASFKLLSAPGELAVIMKTIPEIFKKNIRFLFGILTTCSIIQWLFMHDYPRWAILVFGISTLLVLSSKKHFWSISGSCLNSRNNWLPWLLWIIAVLIRLRHVSSHYSIQDLSARFTLTAIEITRGNPVFPFIPQYEYDESLISWFFAPFLLLFGHAWLTVKVVSIILSTFIVPVSFYYADRILGSRAAFLVSLAVMSCSFFQYTDPMVDMSRFSIVTVFILLSLISLGHVFVSDRPLIWSVLAGLLTILPTYIHSIGRINLAVVIVFIITQLHRKIRENQWKKVKAGIYCFVGIVVSFSVPMVLFIWRTPGYIEFKKKQIYGFHTSFPFSWAGLYKNFYDVFMSFHYKAGQHMFFPSDQPLLQPVIAIGAIGGIWLLLKNIHRPHFATLFSAILLSTVPLAFLTPGLWRCLYFSPAVAFLTISAGIFYYWCIERLLGSKKSNLSVGLLVVVGIIMVAAQIPGYHKQPFPPPNLNINTLLYMDLSKAPDVPHLFSGSIPGMPPGCAIYDLIGSAWVSEYAILYFDPIRLESRRGIVWDPSEKMFEFKEIRLILSQDDTEKIPMLEELFGDIALSKLPNSSLILGVVEKQ